MAGFRNPAWFDRTGSRDGWGARAPPGGGPRSGSAWVWGGGFAIARRCAERHIWPQRLFGGIYLDLLVLKQKPNLAMAPWVTVALLPVCLNQKKVAWNEKSSNAKLSQELGRLETTGRIQPQAGSLNKSQDWDYSDGWKAHLTWGRAAVNSFGRLPQMQMWNKMLEVCLRASVKLKP